MRALQTKKGASSSFLQRFQGKKTTISKQGLLHLFQQHQKKMVNVPNNVSTQVKKNYYDVSSKEILSERSRQIQRLGSDSRHQKYQKKDLTSRLSYRTQVLKKQPMQVLNRKDEFLLPGLGNRFSSSSHYKLGSNQKNNEIQVKKFYLNNEKPQKKMLLGKNMDENALQHLQFLNKLQETLAGLRNKK